MADHDELRALRAENGRLIALLESHGIEYAQGPGVMPPMLEEEFIARLNTQKA